jgi:predicted ATPase
MITRIELDGFKTFKDFEVELGPFEVIVGANGSGKSNLFDALRLLSALVRFPLDRAMQGTRGETDQLFTILPNKKLVDTMRLAVELLVEPRVTDNLGEEVELKCTRLRYELKLHHVKINKESDIERIRIEEETLKPILPENDSWSRKHGLSVEKGWLPKVPNGYTLPSAFIYTDQANGKKMLHLSRDGESGDHSSVAEKAETTMLSTVTTNGEFPHALAVRQEMRDWRFLQLNVEELRASRFVRSRLFNSTESMDLVSTLSRLDPHILKDVSRDLVNLVPGMLKVEVIKRERLSNEREILVTTEDGRTFSWQMLSDGTLRLLALATLRNDPKHRGLLAFEEPENGVHPAALGELAQLLRTLATDFSQSYKEGQPLQQLIVNTHSPWFISQPQIREVSEGILFAYIVTHIEQGQPSLRVTRITPVKNRQELKNKTNNNGSQQYFYTLTQVKKYLNTDNIIEAQIILDKGIAK